MLYASSVLCFSVGILLSTTPKPLDISFFFLVSLFSHSDTNIRKWVIQYETVECRLIIVSGCSSLKCWLILNASTLNLLRVCFACQHSRVLDRHLSVKKQEGRKTNKQNIKHTLKRKRLSFITWEVRDNTKHIWWKTITTTTTIPHFCEHYFEFASSWFPITVSFSL